MWERFDGWLRSSAKIAFPWHPDGLKLATNITLEAHLLGGRPFGDAQELSSFMEYCVRAFEAATSEEERIESFRQSCRDFARRGMTVALSVLPAVLIRYCSEKPLEIALGRMVGDYALIQLQRSQISLIEAEQQVRDNWNADLLDEKDMLARDNVAFATFDTGTTPHGASAQHIAECLALPCAVPGAKPHRRFLVKVAYPAAKVQNHRFPTVAEAGTFPFFQPAEELAPDTSKQATCVGWTKPAGAGPPQPELIHDNASLRVLNSPLELVGSFFL
jgi:hypothetical protein